MRRRTARATFLLVTALAAACARDGGIDPRPLAADRPRATTPTPDLGKLDETVRAFLAREGVRAAHVTVLRHGEVVFEKGYGSVRDGEGPPTPRSVFPIGSISKQFTAAAVLALADEGLVRLDAPVRDYLPEWFAHDPELRVSHLLTHTSGLADFLWLDGYRALGDRAETPKTAFLALGAAAPRRFPPGERWAYSNTNYKALAVLVERVAGRPFDEAVPVRHLRRGGRPARRDRSDRAARLPAGGRAPLGLARRPGLVPPPPAAGRVGRPVRGGLERGPLLRPPDRGNALARPRPTLPRRSGASRRRRGPTRGA